MESIVVKLKKTFEHNQPMPVLHSRGAAGADLCAAENAIIPVGKWALIRTGYAIELPDGYEAQVRPRSGLAFKYGITVLNSPGTIDSDYRGEIKVMLYNVGKEFYSVFPGDRIAQLVVAPVSLALYVLDVELSETERGEGGFGSTGK